MTTSQGADGPSAQQMPDISALYASYGDDLMKTAARELAPFSATSHARDVVSDVFTKLETKGLDPTVKDWESYLHRLAMNRAIDVGRSEARRDKRLADEASEVKLDQDANRFDPAKTIERANRSNALNRAIDALPGSEREVILGLFRDGLKNKDMADKLAVSAPRISQLRSQALIRIRQSLASEGWTEL